LVELAEFARYAVGGHAATDDDGVMHLDFHHVEVSFGHAAIRAFPVFRDIYPAGTGSDAFFWQAQCFFIDETANDALICFHDLNS
jgi:hypothetical protein